MINEVISPTKIYILCYKTEKMVLSAREKIPRKTHLLTTFIIGYIYRLHSVHIKVKDKISTEADPSTS